MSYLGTKIQNTNSLRRPFKPVFEQLDSGNYPIQISNKDTSDVSWFSRHEHLFEEEKWYEALTSRIHLATAFAFMIGLIVALV